jgi:hypothetical protein
MKYSAEATEIVNGAFNFPDRIKTSVEKHQHNYQAIALDAVKIYAENYADNEWVESISENQELMTLITGKVMEALPTIGIKIQLSR